MLLSVIFVTLHVAIPNPHFPYVLYGRGFLLTDYKNEHSKYEYSTPCHSDASSFTMKI